MQKIDESGWTDAVGGVQLKVFVTIISASQPPGWRPSLIDFALSIYVKGDGEAYGLEATGFLRCVYSVGVLLYP